MLVKTLAYMGSTPIAVTTRGDGVTGNITVSKTVVLGSNPSSLVYGAVDKLVKSPAFQERPRVDERRKGMRESVGVCGFDSRQHCYCPIAQLVEKQAVNLTVTGSSPVGAVRRGRHWQGNLFAKQS